MSKYYCNHCNFRTIRKNKLNDHILNNHNNIKKIKINLEKICNNSNKSINITFSTCFYLLKSKFDKNIYLEWMKNLLENVYNFYLIIYTNNESKYIFNKYKDNKNIKIVILEFNNFLNYKYKENWINNNKLNCNKIWFKDIYNSDWKLQLLWSEKINLVNKTITNKYFNTEFYGWCDIGYFRNEKKNLNYEYIKYWPDNDKINKFDKTKIYYNYIGSKHDGNKICLNDCINYFKKRNKNNFTENEIYNYNILSGGFFILHKDNINWWYDTFYEKLEYYFKNKKFIKDDQVIVNDCFFENTNKFEIISSNNEYIDPWFYFSYYLL